MAGEVLRMENITKIYSNGFVANKDITFWLNEGGILALAGENGAGKTTLMKVLFGLESARSGSVLVREQPVRIQNTPVCLPVLEAVVKSWAIMTAISG